MDSSIMVQLLTALGGTFGYTLLFHVPRRFVAPASLGGMLTWGVWLAAQHVTSQVFPASFLASAFGAFYAEVMSRLFRTPSTVIFLPAVIPLVPGGLLYRAVEAAALGKWDEGIVYARQTMEYALGIAAGMCLAWAFCDMSRKFRRIREARSGNK